MREDSSYPNKECIKCCMQNSNTHSKPLEATFVREKCSAYHVPKVAFILVNLDCFKLIQRVNEGEKKSGAEKKGPKGISKID